MEIKNVVNQKLHESHRSRNIIDIVPAFLVFIASLYYQRDKLIIILVAIITSSATTLMAGRTSYYPLKTQLTRGLKSRS